MIGKVDNLISIFDVTIEQLIRAKNKYVILSKVLSWSNIEKGLEIYFDKEKGRRSIPIRKMVGLLIIKQMENLSDDKVVEMYAENPNWQYFCEEHVFSTDKPCDSSELTRFRKRIGEEGVKLIFQESIRIHGEKALEKRVCVDSTVQEKNIIFPTDAKQYIKIMNVLHKIITWHQIIPRRSFKTELKTIRVNLRYSHLPSGKKQASKALRRLRTVTKALLRDIRHKMDEEQISKYQEDFELFNKILSQTKDSKNKIYSLHESHVYCMSKGKKHKKYEFGTKASIARCEHSRVIVGAVAHDKNEHDSKCLEPVLKDANENRATIKSKKKKRVEKAICDRGYRGKKVVEEADVLIPGSKQYSGGYSTTQLKKMFRKRAGIEGTISHLKSDYRMLKNYLKGFSGDQINLSMACCAYNLALWWRIVLFFCIFIFFINFWVKIHL